MAKAGYGYESWYGYSSGVPPSHGERSFMAPCVVQTVTQNMKCRSTWQLQSHPQVDGGTTNLFCQISQDSWSLLFKQTISGHTLFRKNMETQILMCQSSHVSANIRVCELPNLCMADVKALLKAAHRMRTTTFIATSKISDPTVYTFFTFWSFGFLGSKTELSCMRAKRAKHLLAYHAITKNMDEL